MATTSRGSSTTHSTWSSRRGSAQIGAELALGDVEAPRAEADPLLDLDDRPGEAVGLFLVDLEQVERHALGRLGTDAGQAAEAVDQLLDRGGVGSRHSATAEQVAEPAGTAEATERVGLRPAARATWSCASCQAARTRSSSIERSSGSTASGLDVHADQVQVPVERDRDEPAAGGALDAVRRRAAPAPRPPAAACWRPSPSSSRGRSRRRSRRRAGRRSRPGPPSVGTTSAEMGSSSFVLMSSPRRGPRRPRRGTPWSAGRCRSRPRRWRPRAR